MIKVLFMLVFLALTTQSSENVVVVGDVGLVFPEGWSIFEENREMERVSVISFPPSEALRGAFVPPGGMRAILHIPLTERVSSIDEITDNSINFFPQSLEVPIEEIELNGSRALKLDYRMDVLEEDLEGSEAVQVIFVWRGNLYDLVLQSRGMASGTNRERFDRTFDELLSSLRFLE